MQFHYSAVLLAVLVVLGAEAAKPPTRLPTTAAPKKPLLVPDEALKPTYVVQVKIYPSHPSSRAPTHQCSGSIIGAKTVLSTADCLSHAGRLVVVAADKERTVATVKVHPGYNPTTLEKNLALAVVEEAFVFTGNVHQVYLPEKSWKVQQFTLAPLAVCTHEEHSAKSTCNVFTVMDQRYCQGHIPHLKSTEICTNSETHLPLCGKDLGSGLVYYDKKHHKTYVYAVASYSVNKCAEGPATFVILHDFVDWIETQSVK
ncbi:plasma kallikrein-like [Phlebotomus argentipes]|uniref:plasma kallikrein-like n=1 Tax=Phlebotomus argentipes TaxID=94469 RepID=UPI002892B156|nr:plasma kallikrein-like [Phlebotomus argentipes]